MIRSILLVVALACLAVSAAEAEANAAASFDWYAARIERFL